MTERDQDQRTVAPDGRPMEAQPEWRREFPVDTPQANYVADAAPSRTRKKGDPVVVRSKHEIAATLRESRHRGLWFDREMIRFCGRPAVVHERVDRIIHEATGRMVVLRTPCLTLESVVATGEFLRLCPQHEYPLWHEAWLTDAGDKT